MPTQDDYVRLLDGKHLLVEEQFYSEVSGNGKGPTTRELKLYLVNGGEFQEDLEFSTLGIEHLTVGEISYLRGLENLITINRPRRHSFIEPLSTENDGRCSIGLDKKTLDYLRGEGLEIEVVNYYRH